MEWSEIKALPVGTLIKITNHLENTTEVEFGMIKYADTDNSGSFIVVEKAFIYDTNTKRKEMCFIDTTIVRMTAKIVVEIMSNKDAAAYQKIVAAINELTK